MSKNLRIGRRHHYSSLKFSRRTNQKIFVGEHFFVSEAEAFGYRNILCIRRGYHYFPSKFFCLTVPKKFVEDFIGVSECLGCQKNFLTGRVNNYPSLKFSCRTVRKKFVGEHFSVSEAEAFGYRNILCIRMGCYYSPLSFHTSYWQKSCKNHFCVSKDSGV